MSRHATDWAWETDPGSSSLKLILLSMADRADEYNLCYPQREFEFYDDPVDDATGKVEVKLDSNWGKNGRVKIRQLDPLPLSVLAVIPRLTVGGF